MTDHSLNTKKERLLYVFTILAAFLLLFISYRYIQNRSDLSAFKTADFISMRAKVLEITDVSQEATSISDKNAAVDTAITFRAKFTNEYRKGTQVTVTQYIDGSLSANTRAVRKGDTVLIYERHTSEGYAYSFADYWRSDTLTLLALAFCAAVLVFGRIKGLNTLLGLGLTCLVVFMVFVPAILAGCNIYVWSILSCLYSIVFTLLIVNGYNRKTLIAAAGCFSGVLIAGLLTAALNRIMNITGMVDEQSIYLVQLGESSIDLRAIIFSAIIIGATGAVMDVAISISSSLHELNEQMEHPTFGTLLRSGFTIGRDMMGTMANTLVLAYIGSSLATVVLIVAYNSSLMNIMNREMIVVDVEQALVGSLGILSAIPLTSLLAAALYPTRKKTGGPAGDTTDNTEANTLPPKIADRNVDSAKG